MKHRVLILVALIFVILTGCEKPVRDENYVPPERPHLYWKDISVEVVDVDKKHWFAVTHRYEVSVTVKSEEYGITKTLHERSSGRKPDGWDCREGDTTTVVLYSWVMDSTGEVVKREIDHFA